MEDNTNSPPVLGGKIRDRHCTDQRHCPQGQIHAFTRKVPPQGRTSHKTIFRPRPEEFTPPREDSGYPLSKTIKKAKLPPNFLMPQCDLYDGSGDPGEHVSDPVMCQAFPTNLRKAAHAWFKSLRPRSIHSFAQLSDLFQKHFVSSRTRRKNSASLLNVVQERNESLSQYLGRFNAMTLEIDSLDESVKYIAFMRGLRPTSKFAFAPTSTSRPKNTWKLTKDTEGTMGKSKKRELDKIVQEVDGVLSIQEGTKGAQRDVQHEEFDAIDCQTITDSP
ncbi:hypothetical protein RJ639_020097 [Escallonia herrerae]|uniref:Retrotransposon gag domain-containing protein n=1 Tax=Escallonia herrerae TaxID=1293975 RepID=A0AA88VCK7_9ASTE|nr:hypothetical protein RJ639_020097 [Escallonia herrerae]